MKRLVSILLALAVCAALVAVVWANTGSVSVFSDADTKVDYAGYGSLPDGWNTPDFDETGWENAKLYKHSNYLDPTTEAPFSGTGAKWISYRVDQTQLPDYNDPSMIGGDTNFATYLFRKTFQVPATAYNVSGSAAVAADNYGWLYLNGDLVVEATADSGYNFRSGEQVMGTISAPSLECTNVLAARVENGARVSGTGQHGPMGLLFLLDLDYEVPDVMWQPPLTNADFALQDGTTMPLKFKLKMQDGTLITDMQGVYLVVHGPTVGPGEPGAWGAGFVTYNLGEGIESLRFDPCEYYYIANFRTKDFPLESGKWYTAVVHDSCTGQALGHYTFMVDEARGTARGNSGK
ncbi:MAG: hypothetical protein E3J21_19100 [Anaerolineales bacterium]|nr:MAG: hypothetical protein E3J21_19100 [Anaerolineales bacterium]